MTKEITLLLYYCNSLFTSILNLLDPGVYNKNNNNNNILLFVIF